MKMRTCDQASQLLGPQHIIHAYDDHRFHHRSLLHGSCFAQRQNIYLSASTNEFLVRDTYQKENLTFSRKS